MAARADLSVPAGQDQENNAVKHPETVYWGLLCIFKQYVYFDWSPPIVSQSLCKIMRAQHLDSRLPIKITYARMTIVRKNRIH